jgi:hypothetical protein
MLGNTETAYNQVWHLPTSPERLTGAQFIDLANGLLNQKSSHRQLTPLLLKVGGMFDRSVKELIEMQYQNNQDYFFNSDRFCAAFNFTPTSYREGISEVFSHNART